MACNLAPICNFLFRYFLCTVPEGRIDIDITVHMLKGIPTFRKDQTMQVSKCSPWGMKIKPFPSRRKNVQDYIKECQAIVNYFTHRYYPCRPNPSPFARWPKATPVKRSTRVIRCNVDRLSKTGKVNMGYDPTPFQRNWLTQVREAEAAQAPMVAVLTQQAEMSFMFMQPATASVAHTQP